MVAPPARSKELVDPGTCKTEGVQAREFVIYMQGTHIPASMPMDTVRTGDACDAGSSSAVNGTSPRPGCLNLQEL
jgi:hypothetical protein